MLSSERIRNLIEELMFEIYDLVWETYRTGKGKNIIGPTPNAPAEEDQQLGIDEICRAGVIDFFKRKKFPATIYFESGIYSEPNPAYLIVIDEFEGTKGFGKDIKWYWRIVLTVTDLKGNPIVSGAMDFVDDTMWIASETGIVRTCFGDKKKLRKEDRKPRFVHPSSCSGLSNETRLASYLMDQKYNALFVDRARKIFAEKFRLEIFPNGGSGIYAQLADRTFHGYVMCNEPLREFWPALGFLKFGGLWTFFVDDIDNISSPQYIFSPDRLGERIPFFLVTCAKALGERILEHILSGNTSEPQ